MLKIAGTARFVSDLHLRPEREDIAERFTRFLIDTAQRKVAALFILGDLFEYWIGDDDLADAFNNRICWLLRGLRDHGTQLYFISGNRDFLLGQTFAETAGMQLLADTVKVGVGDTAILLLHGDTLCTDDLPYQQFRSMVRAPQWQSQFLARPLTERRAEVASLRQRSAAAMQDKTAAIMDANPASVHEAFEKAGCRFMIHGHTHRPGVEKVELADGSAERWVLSDWETGRGDALEIDESGIHRINLSH